MNPTKKTKNELPAEDEPPLREGRASLGQRRERFVHVVLEAAAEVIADVGFAAMRIEDVALRAGVNKTSIYRRWPTKHDVARAIIDVARSKVPVGPPATGALRSDLVALLGTMIEEMATPVGRAVFRLLIMSEVVGVDNIQVGERLREDNFLPWLRAVDEAIARGEIDPSTDQRLLVETLTSVVITKRLALHRSLDPAMAEKLIDLLLLGVMPRPADGSPSPKKRATARRNAS